MKICIALAVAHGVLASLSAAADVPPPALQRNLLPDRNFTDPALWVDWSGTVYIFGSSDGAGHNMPMATNLALKNTDGWRFRGDALDPKSVEAFDTWAVPNSIRGPEMGFFPDTPTKFGRIEHVFYFSAELQESPSTRCVGFARCHYIGGDCYNTFSHRSFPWVCGPNDTSSATDPGYTRVDNGDHFVTHLLAWNASVMLTQVFYDGESKMTYPSCILSSEALNGDSIRNPKLVESGEGLYFLFFTSGEGLSTHIDYVSGQYGLYGPRAADIMREKPHLMAFNSLKDPEDINAGLALNLAEVFFNGTNAGVVKRSCLPEDADSRDAMLKLLKETDLNAGSGLMGLDWYC